jgi:hypothetical protein
VTPKWPFPGDSAIVRARKIAWAYQAALRELKPEMADELDQRFRSWGENWVAPAQSYGPEDWVTAKEAAAISGLSVGTISGLRVRGRITGVLVDKKRFMYRVADIHRLSGVVRSRSGTSAVRVKTTGRFAPVDWDAIRDESPLPTNGAEQ